jgi:hypothetical protein
MAKLPAGSDIISGSSIARDADCDAIDVSAGADCGVAFVAAGGSIDQGRGGTFAGAIRI